METITFDKAKELCSDGIDKLIYIRADQDQVTTGYAELWVKEYYTFYLDANNRVWVETDAPEEPACWIPGYGWQEESEVEF